MRFKIDPAISNTEDFKGDLSYEGYILNENEGVLNILVIDPSNGVRQTYAAADSINVLSDNLNEFKRNLIRLLLKKIPEQALEQIQNSPTFDEVELIAKQNGANDDDIKNAYRNFHNESALNEQGIISRTVGKTADIAKDVLLGKERQPGVKGLTGIFGLGSRIGSTLKKLGPQGKGDFEFKQRASIFHKDRPRSGQKFSIDFNKDGVGHVITGTVSGDKVSGKDSYIQLKNVKANPPIKQYEKINSVLVDFDLNSPGANFYIYDDSKKMKDSFSGNLAYDNTTKSWAVEDTSKSTIQVKTGQKQKNEKQVAASQQNIKALAQNKGYDTFQEPHGKGRVLFKVKGENVYFDSNFNKQIPKLKP
jgi:hypothetical protein